MIRIICRESNGSEVAHVKDGQIYITYTTFDISAPEVEAYINQPVMYGGRQVVGVEIIQAVNPIEEETK